MNGTALVEGRPPIGFWAQRLDWGIDSVESSVRARDEARSAVAAAGESHHAAHPSGHVFSAASERVAMTMGELTLNGLRHGRPPISASLSRGSRGWLLVVSDAAVDRIPASPGPDLNAVGGLGLRLVSSMALEMGWCLERGRKLVWALVADAPPQRMIALLDQAISLRSGRSSEQFATGPVPHGVADPRQQRRIEFPALPVQFDAGRPVGGE